MSSLYIYTCILSIHVLFHETMFQNRNKKRESCFIPILTIENGRIFFDLAYSNVLLNLS